MHFVGTVSRVNIGNVVTNLDKIQTITTVQDFQSQKAALVQSVTDLKTHLTDQDTQINTLNATINQHQAAISNLTGQNNQLQLDAIAKQKQIDDLNGKLAAVAAAPSTRPLDVATAFKSIVDNIQQQTQQQTSGVATTIQGLEVNLKTLINVDQGGPVLVMPSVAAPLDPAQLSSMKLTFASVPVIARPATPGPAAAPAPSPAAPAAPPRATAPPAPPAPAAAPPRAEAPPGRSTGTKPPEAKSAPSKGTKGGKK